MDPLKYIFEKPMPTGKLAKWQILLSQFDIIYVTHKAVKGEALVDHLAENPLDGEYEPSKTYFPDEEVSSVGEDIVEMYDSWRMFFDGVAYFKGVDIRVILVSEIGQHYSVSTNLRFPCTNNMAEYEACILELRLAIDMNVQELLIMPTEALIPIVTGVVSEGNEVHADMIQVPPNKLSATSSPWPLSAWGMDVIRPIEPISSNRHRFILVAIDYFTKWVEVVSYNVTTKKVVVDFVRDHIVCRFRVPESIITDNAANLNSDMIRAMC
ncbi:uncharacterized protein [Nicotiana tomentosiformis]|uniref:uncharacterized protein n=1 Tax=Nicotiana tomentosiformis TaxID=4098 RepID=UPI00388C7DAB